jgi:N-acetylglutamate synthase-like GNAT family acetyltransferase
MAVHPDCQGQKVGSKFVKFLESEAINLGASEIYLHARDVALPFYQKLGYKAIGDQFVIVGINHHEMYKFISR